MPVTASPQPTAGTRPLLPDLHGCRVLLAEDNPVNQRLLVKLLEHVGVQVSISENGQQALQQVGEQPFDLLLMDVQMPVLDGIAATRAIRQLGAHDQLPIIAISASAFPEDRQRCLAAGMNEFLAKPIRVEQLYACLSQYLGRATPAAPRTGTVAGQPALPLIAGLDTRLGLQHSGGDGALYLTLLQRFLASERDGPQRLRQAMADDDLLSARRLAHTLKGLAASIGAAGLTASAAQLEQAIVGGASGTRLEVLLDELQGRFARLFVGLETFFASAAPAAATADTGNTEPAAPPALIRRLAQLLDAGDTEALDCLEQHAAGLCTSLSSDYPEFERSIRDFDFSLALRILGKHAALDTLHAPGTA